MRGSLGLSREKGKSRYTFISRVWGVVPLVFMPRWTVILIHCLKEEADQIGQRAKLDRRIVSGYVLSIVMAAVAFEQRLYVRLNGFLR